MLPGIGRDVFVVHVADADGPPRRRIKAAKLDVVRLAMLAKVLRRHSLAAGIQRAYFEPGLTECLDGHAPTGSGSDHDHVINFCAHAGLSRPTCSGLS